MRSWSRRKRGEALLLGGDRGAELLPCPAVFFGCAVKLALRGAAPSRVSLSFPSGMPSFPLRLYGCARERGYRDLHPWGWKSRCHRGKLSG